MATHRYLLDTNILSSLLKQPAGPIAKRIATVGEDVICTSIVVACELRYGAAKRNSPALTDKINQLLSAIDVIPLDLDADQRYAQLRSALEGDGKPIGANDCLIAAHALALELSLVTDNVGEFTRVPGLKVENWLTA